MLWVILSGTQLVVLGTTERSDRSGAYHEVMLWQRSTSQKVVGSIPSADSQFLAQNYVIYKFRSKIIFTSVSSELKNLSTVSMLPRSINGITLH